MERVEIGEDVTLWRGDCLEVMKEMKEGSVDAVVTDPPYGIGYNRNIKHKGLVKNPTVIGDDEPFDPAPLLFAKRIVLWGANCYASRLPDSARWLCWHKTLTDGNKSQSGEFDLAWTRGATRSRFISYLWAGCYRDGECGEYYHPTQKPIAVMIWSMDCISVGEGDTVLDPFMGSGTTGVACVKTGRKFIGIEIDPNYFAIAEKRIREATLQLRLPL